MAEGGRRNFALIRDFFQAVRNGDCRKVKRLMKRKEIRADCTNPGDPLKNTALLLACENNDLSTAKLLLSAKSSETNVNAENAEGKRAIWWAAKHGNIELATFLSRLRCKMNFFDKESETSPLMQAIQRKNETLVSLLIQTGADVNLKAIGDLYRRATPLILATQNSNKAICSILIAALCNINAVTADKLTALHFAVANSYYDICQLLLTNGANIHAESKTGLTAMVLAIADHNCPMCDILCQHGYKVNRRYMWKETPLQQAISLRSEGCAMTLVCWGCRLDRDAEQISYFKMAVCEGLLRLAQLLVLVQPRFLHEQWIQQKNWPDSLHSCPQVYQWLEYKIGTPGKLKQLCRAKIFQILGNYTKADSLPLPDFLKGYLKFSKWIKKKKYRRRESVICPFNCPVICPNPSCLPLDVSSSSSSSSSYYSD